MEVWTCSCSLEIIDAKGSEGEWTRLDEDVLVTKLGKTGDLNATLLVPKVLEDSIEEESSSMAQEETELQSNLAQGNDIANS